MTYALVATLGAQDVQVVVAADEWKSVRSPAAAEPGVRPISVAIPKGALEGFRKVIEQRLARDGALAFYEGKQQDVREVGVRDAEVQVDPRRFLEWISGQRVLTINLRLISKVLERQTSGNPASVLLVSTRRTHLACRVPDYAKSILDSEPDFASRVVRAGLIRRWRLQRAAVHTVDIGWTDDLQAQFERVLVEQGPRAAAASLDLEAQVDLAIGIIDREVRGFSLKNANRQVVVTLAGGMSSLQRGVELAIAEYCPGFRRAPISDRSSAPIAGDDEWRRFYDVRRTLRFLLEHYDFRKASRYLAQASHEGRLEGDRLAGVREEVMPLLAQWAELLHGDKPAYTPPDGPPRRAVRGLEAARAESEAARAVFARDLPFEAVAARFLVAYAAGNADSALGLLATFHELARERWCRLVLPADVIKQGSRDKGARLCHRSIAKHQRLAESLGSAGIATKTETGGDRFLDKVADELLAKRAELKLGERKLAGLLALGLFFKLREHRNLREHDGRNVDIGVLHRAFADSTPPQQADGLIRAIAAACDARTAGCVDAPLRAREALMDYLSA